MSEENEVKAGQTPEDTAGETPAEESKAETPAAETPAAETPAAETPADETPAAETEAPTEEPKPEEAPAEETPAPAEKTEEQTAEEPAEEPTPETAPEAEPEEKAEEKPEEKPEEEPAEKAEEKPEETPAPTEPAAPQKSSHKKVWTIVGVVVLAVAVVAAAAWFILTSPGWHSWGQGRYYVPAGSHTPATGVVEVEGARYVFGPDHLLSTGGWTEVDTHTYYAGSDGSLLTGEQEIDGETYHLDEETGEFFSGFYATDAGTLAYDEHGFQLFGPKVLNGVRYYFDADTGVMQTGWFDTQNAYTTQTFYALPEGAMQKGWQTIDEKTYYFDLFSYALQRGLTKVQGEVYYFDDDDGEMLTETFATAETAAGDTTYYLGSDGKALRGWQDLDAGKYHFDDDTAAMNTGYADLDGSRYYFAPDGVLQTGFQTIDGGLYYFGETGIIKAGAYTYDGASRLFDADGRVLEGWQTLGGVTYYYVRGIKQTGEVNIGGTVYNLGSDGILHVGWAGRSYYGSTGYKLTGFQKIGSKTYYFDENGTLGANITVNGYNIDANGVATRQAPAGGSVRACYNSVCSYMRYAHVPAGSYEEMLNYALANHRGSCYHYATLLHYTLAQSGIPSTIIWGTNPQGGTHVWVQLSDGHIVDACNKYYMITPDQMHAMGFNW